MSASGSDAGGASDRLAVFALLVAACGFLMLPIGDSIGKILGEDGMSPIQTTWGRWTAQTLLLTPIVLALYGRAALRPAKPALQVVRGLGIALATICYFTAVREIPLPDAAGVLFVAPLLVTALSGVILRERVGPRRWAAVVIGFLGMLLIVKPGTGAMQLGSLWALAAACLFAGFMILTRHLAGLTKPLISLWWTGLVGTVMMTAIVTPFWQTPTLTEWVMLGFLGLNMAIGHLLILWAADRAEASAMAPMPYMEMVMATTLGYFIFGDFPDLYTWIGCAIVIASGLFVALRERKTMPPPDAER